jgi:hypothetical protein
MLIKVHGSRSEDGSKAAQNRFAPFSRNHVGYELAI